MPGIAAGENSFRLVLIGRRSGRLFLYGDGQDVARDVALGIAETDARSTRRRGSSSARWRFRAPMLIPAKSADFAALEPRAEIDILVGTLRDRAPRDLQQETLSHEITLSGRSGHLSRMDSPAWRT